MEYNDAIDYIKSYATKSMIFGHSRILNLLEELSNPQDKLKFIHIAGTNGKGSTLSMLRYILMEAGYKVGLFVSPAIDDFNDMIQIGASKITNEELVTLTDEVKVGIDRLISKNLEPPTEFEIITVMGLLHFLKSNCDIVIMEVGLGGREDATNIIKTPEVSVITNIGMDHTEQLGDTLEKIATEKAGIIKENCPVVLYEQKDSVEKVFEKIAKEKNAPLTKVKFNECQLIEFNHSYQKFNFKNYKEIELPLLGDFQIYNCATVITTIETLNKNGWKISKDNIYAGLKNSNWQNRFEIINSSRKIILDGGHNLQGVEALVSNLQSYFPNKKFIFVCGVMRDKDYENMFKNIYPLASTIITVTPDNIRALPSDELQLFLSKYHEDVISSSTIVNGIYKAKTLAKSDDIICVFGSLYMAGDARRSAYE